MEILFERWRHAARRPPDPASLGHLLWLPPDSVATIIARSSADLARPYGRTILFSEPGLEVMVARWTPGVACAPHDHGGSIGVVRILHGTCRHLGWRVDHGALVASGDTTHRVGDTLPCAAGDVHAIATSPTDPPLVTLHAYAPAIRHMVVYDLERRRTLVVPGDDGAWIPDDPKWVIDSVVPASEALRSTSGAPPPSGLPVR